MARGWLPWLVCVLLLAAIAYVRLSATFAVPYWSDDASYSYLRHAALVSQTGGIPQTDPLSYDGRTWAENPILSTLFSILIGGKEAILASKILNIILGILVPSIVFLIVREITSDLLITIASLAIAGFIPLHYFLTVNSFSSLAILLPLMLAGIFTYIKYEKSASNIWLFISLAIWIIAGACSPFALLLPLGLVCYILILWLERVPISRLQIEFAIAVSASTLVINYLLASKIMLAHGASLFRHMYIYAPYVTAEQILPLLPQMGLFIVAIAVVAAYRAFFVQQRQETVLFTGFLCAPIIALIFGLLSAEYAFLWISIISVLFFPIVFQDLERYLSVTKFAAHAKIMTTLLLFFILLSAIFPTYFYTMNKIADATPQDLATLLNRAARTTPESSIIIAPIDVANIVMYMSGRATYADTDTLLISDAALRKERIAELYTAIYRSQLIDLLPSLHIWKNRPAYLLYSPNFGVNRPSTHLGCIKLIDQEGVYELYKVTCNV